MGAGSRQRNEGTSLLVRWPRLCAPNAGGPGFDPRSRNCIPHAAAKSLHAATKEERGTPMADSCGCMAGTNTIL